MGLDSYPVLTGASDNRYIGGESVQISLLARAFQEIGWEVSVITGDYGQPDEDAGTVSASQAERAPGRPVLRFFYRRVYSFLKSLTKADAEIYYQSCAGYITGLVAWPGVKKFVFRTAHDTDCIPNQQIVASAWQEEPTNTV